MKEVPLSPDLVRYVRGRLVRWYRANRRDLPWRRTADPYRIWISEAMLQQTRVATAIPYYERFVERLPDARALAAAPVDEVLTLWAGLGYYRRARLLKAAAERVVREHGGALPSDEHSLLALPGIGRYTAGAIRSIAFGERAPLLDGNVFRVFARLFALSGSWSREADKRRFWEIAAALVPARNPGEFNQALMELGALVCGPRGPDCPGCPVRRRCEGFAAGAVDRFPEARLRREPERVRRAMYVVTDARGRLLLRRRPAGGRMAGLWETPDEPCDVDGVARRVGSFRHAILHRRYEVDVYALRVRPAALGRNADRRWVAREDLGDIALTTMAKKAIRLAEGEN